MSNTDPVRECLRRLLADGIVEQQTIAQEYGLLDENNEPTDLLTRPSLSALLEEARELAVERGYDLILDEARELGLIEHTDNGFLRCPALTDPSLSALLEEARELAVACGGAHITKADVVFRVCNTANGIDWELGYKVDDYDYDSDGLVWLECGGGPSDTAAVQALIEKLKEV